MASRGSQTERDLDDWFAETDLAPRRQHRQVAREHESMETVEAGAPAADDWLDRGTGYDEAPPRPRSPNLADSRLWIALAAVAALVVIGLYVGGVFDSGTKTPPATTPPANTQTTHPKTGTTPKTVPTKHQVALPTVALKRSDAGTEVKKLQRTLASLGYSPGKVDGRFGPATEKALTRFQKAKKLKADGILGPKTLAALRAAAAG
jgi:hypothetical protein